MFNFRLFDVSSLPLYNLPILYKGPLAGGPQCRMSNLRNDYVNCHYSSNFHVDFKMVSCRMSNLMNGLCHVHNILFHVDRLHVACRF